ncbi:MAG TPA: hypothetical protein VG889_12360 [Rhizomicrobium sp.]|nr:hypothetical protein [Rhizomicrobium sp.]
MSDLFKFDVRPRAGALAEGAERLGRLANIVKDQQLERVQSGVRRPDSEAYVASPEEAWSKKYMIQCVGPVCTVRPTDEGALLLPRFQPEPEPQALAPKRSIAVTPAPAAEDMPKPQAARGKRAAEPIGLAIGKPVRKRSLLGRMFGR